MKYTILLLSFLLASFTLRAQNNHSVKGVVTDTASNAKLVNASVSVLNEKDSTLVTFTRAADDGTFLLVNLPKGKFILLVTYPEYADYVENFKLDSVKPDVDFKNLTMTLKSRLLQEVIIKGTAAAIKIKGDTTEYNAAAFKIQPNAKVEDLLKQLPGMQVDKDGKITAQGQTVNKVLVDGEEFFGDDPTLVTKNLRADMVDKVQLYDKKSDQATFTGVDDGEKTKTINIKLKEDKKSGMFGKADVGVGTNKYYQGQLLFNRFKAKKKFSAYGTLANTGKTGLSWRDADRYGGDSGNMEFMDGGGIMIMNFGGGDELEQFGGNYGGEGIPLARTGGMHYDSKWNDDKESINANYKVGSLAVDGSRTSESQNSLQGAGAIINSFTDETFNNFIFRQKIDGMYQVKLDSTSNLKATFDATFKNSETITSNTGSSSFNDVLRNRSTKDLNNKGDQSAFNASLFYTKKMKKTGRTLSVNLSSSLNKNNAKGYLKSDLEFYKDGALDSTSIIDQYKTNDTKSSVVNTNIAYTEPLSKSLTVVLNYGLGINNGTSDKRSYDKNGNNYNRFVDSLSSDFKLNQLSNQVGAIFNFKKGKSIINFGTKAATVAFKQVNLFADTTYKRNFTNWFPQASYQYRFSQQRGLRFNYNGNTTQPSIDQIQPIRNNNNPLNQIIGNPGLRPSFTSRFNLGYNEYKVLTDQSIWINGSYSFTTNAIVSSSVTDTSRASSTYQSVNLSGKTPNNFYGAIYYDKKIKWGDFNIGVNANVNGNTYYSIINGDMNMTKSYTYSAGLSFSKYKREKYDFRISANPNYTISETSLQKNANSNGKGFNSSANFNVYLPLKFQISSDINMSYQAKTASFANDFTQYIWNASLSKTFLKENNLKLSLSGNDLLNQNSGFERNSYNGIIEQKRNTTIRRYFLFSLVYDFNKMGGGVKTQN